ncbi:DUF4880 domain-containing protein [Zoogloea sp. LCSB751]|uniref:DUF4880 domain-containing protein n=1 Tax=Zoogloea sp. LCSB751 TaxID=1965277 RepID=UPI001374803E|nr:DUF4880 domain-containing protein [Zoogloea sp. LCSB751]
MGHSISVEDEAVKWFVALKSGDAGPDEQAAFQEWLGIDPQHQAAWLRLESALGAISLAQKTRMPAVDVDRLLKAPSASRRRFLGGGALAVSSLWLGQRIAAELGFMPKSWGGDYWTGVGERKQFQLVDSSVITLNACTSIRLDGARSRSLFVDQGKLLADIALDANLPFVLSTPHGHVSLDAGRIQIDVRREKTRVTTLDSINALAEVKGGRQLLEPGQSLGFDSMAIESQQPSREYTTAWQDGWLEVKNQPLSEVVDQLRPYFNGVITVSAEIAQIGVSGRFSLDDTDKTLDALVQTLPLRVNRRTRFWVLIEPGQVS